MAVGHDVGMHVRSASLAVPALLGEALSAREANLRVLLAAGGLLLLGVVLLMLTIWWWRGTREEPEALGVLELMSDRRYLKASDEERREMLEAARRHDAERAAIDADGFSGPVAQA